MFTELIPYQIHHKSTFFKFTTKNENSLNHSVLRSKLRKRVMKLIIIPLGLVIIFLLRVYLAVEFMYFDLKKGLVFTYLGTRYCGPGTEVEVMDKLYGPITEVDWACREHDLIYTEAYLYSVEELWKHDDIFMERVKESGSNWYPAFWRVFTSKRIWEKYIGPPYTEWHTNDDDQIRQSLIQNTREQIDLLSVQDS